MNIAIGMSGTLMWTSPRILCTDNYIFFEGNDMETSAAISVIHEMVIRKGGSDEDAFKAICECVTNIAEYEMPQNRMQVANIMASIRKIASNAVIVVVDCVKVYPAQEEVQPESIADQAFREGAQLGAREMRRQLGMLTPTQMEIVKEVILTELDATEHVVPQTFQDRLNQQVGSITGDIVRNSTLDDIESLSNLKRRLDIATETQRTRRMVHMPQEVIGCSSHVGEIEHVYEECARQVEPQKTEELSVTIWGPGRG